jgi:hypothetical protein
MRIMQAALRAGTVAIAVVGLTGMALAQTPRTHVLTVALPGGGIEQIRYAGNVAPQVYVSDSPAPVFAAMPSPFGSGSPFAEFERISAAMDRRADQLMREAAALSVEPTQINPTAIAALPAGAREYQFVSTMNGNGVCSRSVEITSAGNGAPPHVVTRTSGNCSAVAAPGFQVPTQAPTGPVPANGPRMIMTKAVGVHPYAGLIHEASLN